MVCIPLSRKKPQQQQQNRSVTDDAVAVVKMLK